MRFRFYESKYNSLNLILGLLECEYRFTRQPPTALNCTPYDSVNRLALACSAEGPNTPTFSVIWFRRRNNGDEEVLQDSQQRVKIDVQVTSDVDGTAQSTRRSSRLALRELNEMNDVGQYWCQVRLENGTLFQEKSNTLSLNDEEQYVDLRPCEEFDRHVDQLDCLQIMGPSGNNGDTSITDGSVVLHTTSFNLPPIPTTGGPDEESESGSNNLAALSAVIAVIVVFCIVIVTLTIIIVVLYRKKCGPIKFKTEGK